MARLLAGWKRCESRPDTTLYPGGLFLSTPDSRLVRFISPCPLPMSSNIRLSLSLPAVQFWIPTVTRANCRKRAIRRQCMLSCSKASSSLVIEEQSLQPRESNHNLEDCVRENVPSRVRQSTLNPSQLHNFTPFESTSAVAEYEGKVFKPSYLPHQPCFLSTFDIYINYNHLFNYSSAITPTCTSNTIFPSG